MKASSAISIRMAIACVVMTSACESSTGPGNALVRSVVIDSTTLTIVVGQSHTLRATALDESGRPVSTARFGWRSSNASVVTVSNVGVVRAVSRGEATVTASAGEYSASTTVTVRSGASQLTFSSAELSLSPGESITVYPYARDASGALVATAATHWTSSNPSVATVESKSGDGMVVAVAPGISTLTASLDGVSATLNVTVGAVINVAGFWDVVQTTTDTNTGIVCTDTGTFAVSQSSTTLQGPVTQIGQCRRDAGTFARARAAHVMNARINFHEVRFDTFGPNATQVCQYAGTVESDAASVHGTVSCGAQVGTWQATIGAAVATIALRKLPPTDSILRGAELSLEAHLTNSLGRRVFLRSPTWSSDNPQAASVASDGVLTAKVTTAQPGVAQISATIGAARASTNIVVHAVVFTSVHTGFANTCALTTDGKSYCWGTYSVAPLLIFSQSRFEQVSVMRGSGCGLDAQGVAYCWNAADVTTTRMNAPQVPTSLRFSSISVGGWFRPDFYFPEEGEEEPHTCAISSTSVINCWGNNEFGQLGAGSAAPNLAAPTQVEGGRSYVAVSAGRTHTCALRADGKAECWGGNEVGQLGDGTFARKATPVNVSSATSFVAIYASSYHTCALTGAGSAWCWGSNQSGSLGVSGGTRNTPIEVSGGFRFTRLAVGLAHSCGLTSEGDVYCWGSNANGELGIGENGSASSLPRRIAGTTRFASISSGPGATSTCGMSTSGRAYCWGQSGYFDGGVKHWVPTLVPGQF